MIPTRAYSPSAALAEDLTIDERGFEGWSCFTVPVTGRATSGHLLYLLARLARELVPDASAKPLAVVGDSSGGLPLFGRGSNARPSTPTDRIGIPPYVDSVYIGHMANTKTWPGRISAITLFTDDLEATKRFYEEVFELPVHFEDDASVVFDFGNTLINLLRTTAAVELIDPAEVGGSAAAPRMQFTIDVDDVDATCARLESRGVTLLNGPIDRPWGIRTAAFRDPAGHIWEVAH
jgi:lactoylglutathione lyase